MADSLPGVAIAVALVPPLTVVGITMSGAIKQSKVERHYGWRAKSEKVSQEEEHQTLRAFLQRLKSAVRDTREADSAPPKSDLQRLLDRRRRDTAPFDLGR